MPSQLKRPIQRMKKSWAQGSSCSSLGSGLPGPRWQDDSHDEAIQCQGFREDEYEDHPDKKFWLLGISSAPQRDMYVLYQDIGSVTVNLLVEVTEANIQYNSLEVDPILMNFLYWLLKITKTKIIRSNLRTYWTPTSTSGMVQQSSCILNQNMCRWIFSLDERKQYVSAGERIYSISYT